MSIIKTERKKLAIAEVLLLITAIIAFSYVISLGVPSVSAQMFSDLGASEGLASELMRAPVNVENFDFTTIGATVPTPSGEAANFWDVFFRGAEGSLGQNLGAVISAGIGAFVIAGVIEGIRRPGWDWESAAGAGFRGTIGAGAGAALNAWVWPAILGTGPAGWLSVATIVGLGYAASFLKREQDRTAEFVCKPWKAESGGENCELCNDELFECTEYQCRSLGAGCELINKDTDDARCVWKDPQDVEAAEIFPWEDVLGEGYRYDPLPRGEYGVEINYQNEECLPAFEPFSLGIELKDSDGEDKEGYCKLDFERKEDFSDMQYDFGGSSLYLVQHLQIMSFPGVAHIQDFIERMEAQNETVNEINNDGEYEIYVRCESPNGVHNREEFLFKFCVDKGEDVTAPEIRGFNWNDGESVSYFSENETREVNVQVYTNEPAQCKWGWEDKDYEDLENSLGCSDSSRNVNNQLNYICSGKLTGLENNAENKFFFRCQDTLGNTNAESKTLTLLGTEALFINSAGPNEETIKGGTSPLRVTLTAETGAGVNRGEATCEYKNAETGGSYIVFSETGTHQHSTNIRLDPGDYEYSIRCRDAANNAETVQIGFTVETDTSSPIVVRAFRENNNLKIITNERASCVYDTVGCNYNFEDGNDMSPTNSDRSHTTEWNPNRNFYIKCEDEFGNRPSPNQCSITVRPFEVN